MKLFDRHCLLMQVQVQVQPQQQQIQESTSQQQSVQQNTEQQIVQVCTFIAPLRRVCHLILFHFIQGPLNFGLPSLFSGADPGPAARSDAGSGPPSTLWFPSTATRCDHCTADSARGTHRGAAPTGALKHAHAQHNCRIANFVISQSLNLVTNYHIPHMSFSYKPSWWQLLQEDNRSKSRQSGLCHPPSSRTVQREGYWEPQLPHPREQVSSSQPRSVRWTCPSLCPMPCLVSR